MNESNLPADRPANLHPGDAARGPGYEVRDTNVRALVIFIACLFLFVAVAQWGLWALLGLFRDRAGEEAFVKPVSTSSAVTPGQPAPPSEFGINEQLRQLRSYEKGVLAGQGPAGDSSGKTVIAVDRALDLLIERGIPPIAGPAQTEAEVNAHSGGPSAKNPGDKK